MGDTEYDKSRDAERKEEQLMEMNLRQEIARRRKEICKKRGNEIHDGRDIMESNKQKRRKLDNDQYKTVIQLTRNTEKDDKEEITQIERKRP